MCVDQDKSETLAANAQERAFGTAKSVAESQSYYRPGRFAGITNGAVAKQTRDEYGPLGPTSRGIDIDHAFDVAPDPIGAQRGAGSVAYYDPSIPGDRERAQKAGGLKLRDPAQTGPGGAPTRATTLDDTPAGRKRQPVASGVLDYFPDALVAIAEVSFAGNEQHNPGMSLRWTRGKSADEGDALVRHFLQRGGRDTDGIRHSAKLAWRALALLQKEIEGVQ